MMSTVKCNYHYVLVEELRSLYALSRDVQSVLYYARPFIEAGSNALTVICPSIKESWVGL